MKAHIHFGRHRRLDLTQPGFGLPVTASHQPQHYKITRSKALTGPISLARFFG